MLARPEVGTKEHILMWLASKPADEVFNWHSTKHCACGQYAETFFYGLGCWSYNSALSEMNVVAFFIPTFGKLHEAMRERWRL